MFGASSLFVIMRKEGQYSELCASDENDTDHTNDSNNNNNNTNNTFTTAIATCASANVRYSQIYTAGAFGTPVSQNDLIKIRLVRALLALPEVLVLDEVGDDMSVQDLQEMHKVLVAYLEYKIPGVDDTETCKLLRKVANVPRTIIWSGFKRTLQPYVDAKNFMLVVKDSSKIIFTAPDGAW